jgi:hypothetical protein
VRLRRPPHGCPDGGRDRDARFSILPELRRRDPRGGSVEETTSGSMGVASRGDQEGDDRAPAVLPPLPSTLTSAVLHPSSRSSRLHGSSKTASRAWRSLREIFSAHLQARTALQHEWVRSRSRAPPNAASPWESVRSAAPRPPPRVEVVPARRAADAVRRTPRRFPSALGGRRSTSAPASRSPRIRSPCAPSVGAAKCAALRRGSMPASTSSAPRFCQARSGA